MKKQFFVAALVAATIVQVCTSCTSDSPILDVRELDSPTESNPWYISAERAVEIANANRLSLLGEQTRSSLPVRVEKVRSTATRYSEAEDLYYIINYGSNDGFAVVSADSRVNPIQAISDNGSLSMSDTLDNKGLALFFNQLNEKANRPYEPVNPPIKPDSIKDVYEPPVSLSKKETKDPLLHLNVRKWHQRAPFNYQCPLDPAMHMLRSLVGCLALSSGQIMSYFEWPNSINGTTIDWAQIKSNDYDQIAWLLATLGSNNLLNLNYDTDRTSGKEESIIPTFLKAGYSSVSKRDSFSESTAYWDIKRNGPLLVYGESNFDSGSRHAWVIDGYIYTENAIYVDGIQTDTDYGYLFHCVWGAEGRGDGYFRWEGNGFAENAEVKVEGDSYGMGYYNANLQYMYGFQK